MINEKFWLAIAFITFVLLLIKFARSFLLNALDNKAKLISDEIKSAKNAREQAEQALIKAEEYLKESIEYGNQLIIDAKKKLMKL